MQETLNQVQEPRWVPALSMRAATADDEAFIYSSWLHSYRSSPWAQQIDKDTYYDHHKAVVKRLLEESFVVIAASPDQPDHILGYAVFQVLPGATVLHYLYVKHPYRRLGIAGEIYKTILERARPDASAPVTATHMTPICAKVMRRRWQMTYNPYIIGT